MKYIKLLLLSLFVIAIQGCTTLADARKAEGEGAKKIYQADYEKTWSVVIKSISKLKLELASENKSDGYILAQRGISAFSYGENVAIFIKPKTKIETSVEVVSKKAMTTNIFAPDWSEDIHKEIALGLNQ